MEIDLPVASGGFSFIDIEFARLMNKLSHEPCNEVYLAAALVSKATQDGNVCLVLADLQDQPIVNSETGEAICICPSLERWTDALLKSGVVGKPGEFKPLVLDSRSRLYLYRYWQYEKQFASMLLEKARLPVLDLHTSVFSNAIKRAFPSEDGQANWQRLAAFIAVTKALCIISGGPGTGKTTTITRILGLIQAVNKEAPLTMAICAPTGKAAARLQEALRAGKARLDFPDDIKKQIPAEAKTIHRLLGPRPIQPYFRHNRDKPLPVDLVVVDESSMVDLALMFKLLDAMPSHGRVILVGDRDQLASVEAGSVLGDICQQEFADFFSPELACSYEQITGDHIPVNFIKKENAFLADCIVQLRKSYRFAGHSGIGALSRCINQGNGRGALSVLKSKEYTDTEWRIVPSADALPLMLKSTVISGFSKYLVAQDPVEVFREFERFRVLCALREGPFGVANLNHTVEQLLYRSGLLEPKGVFYPGRPVMITRNDYNLGLYNGDIGIIVGPRPGYGDGLRALFLSAEGEIRSIHPSRLPEHETAFAMTVHKSQGSEFDHVLFIMPDRPSPVLTRELVYTAVTRARKKVEIWGKEDIFSQSIMTRTRRGSGLKDLLWEK